MVRRLCLPVVDMKDMDQQCRRRDLSVMFFKCWGGVSRDILMVGSKKEDASLMWNQNKNEGRVRCSFFFFLPCCQERRGARDTTGGSSRVGCRAPPGAIAPVSRSCTRGGEASKALGPFRSVKSLCPEAVRWEGT